jgi:hypothetical protein
MIIQLLTSVQALMLEMLRQGRANIEAFRMPSLIVLNWWWSGAAKFMSLDLNIPPHTRKFYSVLSLRSEVYSHSPLCQRNVLLNILFIYHLGRKLWLGSTLGRPMVESL